jgi:hypothetical protein
MDGHGLYFHSVTPLVLVVLSRNRNLAAIEGEFMRFSGHCLTARLTSAGTGYYWGADILSMRGKTTWNLAKPQDTSP